MPHLAIWRRYLRFWRADVDGDIDDELRFHLETRTEALRAEGFSPEQATRTALAEFGDVLATRRQLHEIGIRVERRRERARWWHAIDSDLRYTIRGLRVTPVFTFGVVLTLALGIGAEMTMYGMMRRLLLESPPHVREPDRIVRPYFHYMRAGDSEFTSDRLSYPLFERLSRESRTLEAVAAYDPNVEMAMGSGADARMVRATLVSGGFWRADAYHALARECGFGTWPKLKAHVIALTEPTMTSSPLAGAWAANYARSKRHPLDDARSTTLQITVRAGGRVQSFRRSESALRSRARVVAVGSRRAEHILLVGTAPLQWRAILDARPVAELLIARRSARSNDREAAAVRRHW